MRVLVVVHVYYPQLWPELADCICNICEPKDIVITYIDETAVAQARRDIPLARFLLCENHGYDIWPFLKVIQTVDLAKYDVIVKLHTKRDIDLPRKAEVGYTVLNGSRWRDYLLAFVKTPEAWRKTVARFGDPAIGMVADRHVVFRRCDAKREAHGGSFDVAVRELGEKWGVQATMGGRFVGGTMFAVRASILARLISRPFVRGMFGESGGHESETYAHVVERMFGLIVSGLGYRVEGFDGSVFWRRFWAAIGKFFFDSRRTERRRSVRICKITVYLRRLQG